jgi:hypothetical protein
MASVLSVGSAFSSGSFFSIASTGSFLSIGSSGSVLSIGASGGVLAIGPQQADGTPDPAAPARALATCLTVAALVAAVRRSP